MDWLAYITPLLMIVTIALGAIGWLAPRYTMDLLDTAPKDGSTMGLSEVRAASGALFVGLGIAGLLLPSPWVAVTVGFAWAGATIGRVTSIMMDGATPGLKVRFAIIEAIVAALLIGLNWPAEL